MSNQNNVWIRCLKNHKQLLAIKRLLSSSNDSLYILTPDDKFEAINYIFCNADVELWLETNKSIWSDHPGTQVFIKRLISDHLITVSHWDNPYKIRVIDQNRVTVEHKNHLRYSNEELKLLLMNGMYIQTATKDTYCRCMECLRELWEIQQ